ncbi:MAG: phage integrase SAM-like domain-containing protein [Paludibacter sp.]|nr:phage integrase SAM-like domain-containing protein [Paludibacter sp.]
MIGFYSDRGSIYAKFRQQKNGEKTTLVYYPGMSDEGFNKETKRFKDQELQKQITGIENAIFKIIEAQNPFYLTNEDFAKLINEHLTGKTLNQTPFFEYCERYFEYACKITTRRRAQTVRTTINKIKEFRPDLTFETIDKKFFREFMEHCNKKGFATNYTGSVVRDLKRILNYATENDDNTNMAFRSFKKPMEEVFNVYLTEIEVQKIYDLVITPQLISERFEARKKRAEESKIKFTERMPDALQMQNKIIALNRSRKLFVIGCWTGLRVENYLDIDPEIQIDLEKGFIHAIANKNGPKLRIPLHRIVRDIVESGGFPKPISPQNLNYHVKELGELAGINETVIYFKTIGGRRIEYVKPKYEMLTSHTARRSFASNLIVRGIPKQYIMAVTGHKTESSFNKYTQAVQKDIMTEKLADYDVWG